MVSRISEITYEGDITSTTATFLPVDRGAVEAQIGATGGSNLIEFTAGSATVFHGIVGVNAAGNRMLGPNHLVARPCPPFCPTKATAKAAKPYP